MNAILVSAGFSSTWPSVSHFFLLHDFEIVPGWVVEIFFFFFVFIVCVIISSNRKSIISIKRHSNTAA